MEDNFSYNYDYDLKLEYNRIQEKYYGSFMFNSKIKDFNRKLQKEKINNIKFLKNKKYVKLTRYINEIGTGLFFTDFITNKEIDLSAFKMINPDKEDYFIQNINKDNSHYYFIEEDLQDFKDVLKLIEECSNIKKETIYVDKICLYDSYYIDEHQVYIDKNKFIFKN